MDFGEVLGTAWKIIWKHKILWIFGIFAGCSRGGGGGNGGGGSGGNVPAPGGGVSPYQNGFTQFTDWLQAHPWVIVLFVIILLLIFVLAILIGTMGHIGLIRGTQKADNGAERLGFMELWDGSRPYFWRVFLLSLLVGLAVFVGALVLAAVAVGFTAITLGVGFLCLIPLICLLVPALILLGIVVQQAETAIVIENLGLQDGLRRGWEVFRQNLGPMLLMWLILLVIAIIVGVVIALPVLIVVIPAAIAFGFANAGFTEAVNAPTLALTIAAVCFCVYLPVLLVLNGILTAYLQSAWTLTYLRLTRPKSETLIESPAPAAPAPNA
jgi:hypothetical protein